VIIKRQLTGSIELLEDIDTRIKLYNHLLESSMSCYVVTAGTMSVAPGGPILLAQNQPNPLEGWSELWLMYQPLNIPGGLYMVNGIEGRNYDGYANDAPWPLEVVGTATTFDIMEAVSQSSYNGYPNAHHIYFEDVTIDTELKTISFSMGS